ncbi:MAG: hypothetical protein DMF96_29760 [Acidobacteria bacterium]|nr:MAG: hypothetical protein DMF96_29760 [Acidobacteriota bacterium]
MNTNGRASTRAPSSVLRRAADAAGTWVRGVHVTSRPFIAATARSANAEAETLVTQKASRLSGNGLSAQRPPETSMASGVMATWLDSVNRPANRASASSFAPKTRPRPMGSGIRTRKSVSSGKSEWLTRTVTNATIHIDSVIASAVSASFARA